MGEFRDAEGRRDASVTGRDINFFVRDQVPAGDRVIPTEAWDSTHPDHEWWVEGTGECLSDKCEYHKEDYAESTDRQE